MSKVEAVLFDKDGVLLDSDMANFALFESILEGHGYKPPKIEDYVKLRGNDDESAFREMVHPKAKREMDELLNDIRTKDYPPGLLKIPEGEAEVIERLSKEYKLGIVTNGFREGVEYLFKISPIEKYFDIVVTREDFKMQKPSPEPLLLAASRLKISPSRAVYIGDTKLDVQAARAAGMMFIGYDTGLKQFTGVEIVVKSFREIPIVVKNLEKA